MKLPVVSTTTRFVIACGLFWAVATGLLLDGQAQQGDGPRYKDGASLVRPTDYRTWAFLGAGLGLTYETEKAQAAAAAPSFTSVFVNPSSYRRFMETGGWPNGTIFVLEIRRSETNAAPNVGGRFQGELLAVEAEVKDARFTDGWAFFNFGRVPAIRDVAEPLAGSAVAPCVECHTKHTAVERTFVQFYPTLLEVARQKRTLKPGF